MNSNRRVLSCMLSLVVLLIFGLAASAFTQEHPEHPKAKTKGEEHPKAMVSVSKEMLAEAIEGYIKKDADLKGGYFLVYDAKAKTALALTLDKVHRDKLAMVSEGLYFACTDLKSTDGEMYDLDFFMKATESGLQISEVMIHKKAGTARYTWVEDGGMWKRK